MSIANKFNYLLETKNKIKEALISKGAIVSTADTFRSYADKIRNIEGGESSTELDLEAIETPIIKLKGDNPQIVAKNTEYVEAGVEVLNHATTTEVSIQQSINTNYEGNYAVIYTATDSQTQNTSKIKRKVVVGRPPHVWFWNTSDLKEEIPNNKLFNRNVKIEVENTGTIVLFTKNGEDFANEYDPAVALTEGEYRIKVTAENGTFTDIEFIIDTMPPEISGIKSKTYKTVATLPKVTFEDYKDISEATITNVDTGTVINVKEIWSIDETTGKAVLNVANINIANGNYRLVAKDAHGVEATVTFKIQIPEESEA